MDNLEEATGTANAVTCDPVIWPTRWLTTGADTRDNQHLLPATRIAQIRTASTDGDGINAAGVIVGDFFDNAGVEHGYIATRQ